MADKEIRFRVEVDAERTTAAFAELAAAFGRVHAHLVRSFVPFAEALGRNLAAIRAEHERRQADR